MQLNQSATPNPHQDEDSTHTNEKLKKIKNSKKRKKQKKSKKRSKPESKLLKYSKIGTFALSGFLSLYSKYLMINQAGTFNELYSGMDYNFYVLVPMYVCVPIALLAIKIISNFSFGVKFKILISTIGMAVSFSFVPLIALYKPHTPWYFFLVLAVMFVTFTFATMYQGYFMALASIYNPYYTNLFCLFQPGSNLFIIGLEYISLFLGFDTKREFLLYWVVNLVLSLSLCVVFWVLVDADGLVYKYDGRGFAKGSIDIPGPSDVRNDSLGGDQAPQESNQQEKVDYFVVWPKIKIEALGMFFTMFMYFLISPGVFFSLPPPTLFTQKKFIFILSNINAVFDVIGRLAAYSRYTGAFIKTSFVTMAACCLFLVYCYMVRLNEVFDGLAYVVFVLMVFGIFRTSLGVSFYLGETTRKANKRDKESIGSLMSSMIMFGIAAGNFVSDSFPTIRGWIG